VLPDAGDAGDSAAAGSVAAGDAAADDAVAPTTRIRLDIAYEGTAFLGWAKQPGLRTVQGELEAALATIFGRFGAPPTLTVAGRTDAGVHALDQVAHLDLTAAQLTSLKRPPRGRTTKGAALLEGSAALVRRLNGIAGLSTNSDRWNGAQSVFKKYPGIHVIASANADWDQAKGQTATANMLSAHPNVNGVWSQGGAMTLGAIQAFQAAGHPLVPMTGELNNGFLKKWLQLRKSGIKTFASAASTKPTTLAVKALEQTLSILKGQKYTRNFIESAPLITAKDLKKVRQAEPAR